MEGPVIDDPDIFHAAKLLIDQHGIDALRRGRRDRELCSNEGEIAS